MWSCYDKYILPMMKKRSKERNLKVVDLWWALGKPAWFESVDRHNADIVTDLSKTRWLADNSLWYVRAHHILEHLEPIHAMNELWRCCAHGAIIDIEVPSDCGLFTWWKYFPPTGNRSDPTHISSWNERSFRYYTERTMRRYIQPECTCMFNVIKPAETVLKFDNVPCVKITLMAEKWWERIYGSNDWRWADGKYL
jgi:predicted SAM-dependent methyltransferase